MNTLILCVVFLIQAVKYLERMLVQAQSEKERNRNLKKDESNSNTAASPDSSVKEINIDPKTYCKLGHFHLLLEDYSKGKCFEKFLKLFMKFI